MKKVSLLLVLAFAAITMTAQEAGRSTERGYKTTFKQNGIWDNWFVGAGAGANIYMDGESQHTSFFSRPTLNLNVQVGKWLNPWLGVRGKVSGGSLHTWQKSGTSRFMRHQKMIMGEVDAMVDVTNLFGKYNENRFYSFIPYVGAGIAGAWREKVHGVRKGNSVKSIAVNAGIINKFRLTNRLSLDIEISGNILKEGFDKKDGGNWSYDGNTTTSASLIYKLGHKTTSFSEAILADQGLIDDLNSQINKLRQENAILSKRPERCDECPEPQIIKQEAAPVTFVSNVVFFRINSAVIDKHQAVNVHNTAQYLKENPNAKVKVVGYADKKTGNASINDKLSEKRAKAVANELIKKHNIDSNRVTVEWKGDSVQPYAQNEWNRVAIFYAD